jgi:hypothetical protein
MTQSPQKRRQDTSQLRPIHPPPIHLSSFPPTIPSSRRYHPPPLPSPFPIHAPCSQMMMIKAHWLFDFIHEKATLACSSYIHFTGLTFGDKPFPCLLAKDEPGNGLADVFKVRNCRKIQQSTFVRGCQSLAFF